MRSSFFITDKPIMRNHTFILSLAGVLAGLLAASCSVEREFSDYMALKEPRIAELDTLQVMVCKVQGDPAAIQRKAMRVLYKAFDQVQAMDDSLELVRGNLRARWPEVMRTSTEEWVGLFALPVPDTIAELPVFDGIDIPITLERWVYGPTAEILHLGPYDTDNVTVDRLHRHIIENGYRIRGMHEEEYVSGPGMYFDGNPERYVTVIRYPVEPIPDDTDRLLDYGM